MNSTLSSSLSSTFLPRNHKTQNLSSSLQNPNSSLFYANSLSTKHRKLLYSKSIPKHSNRNVITSRLFTFRVFNIGRTSECVKEGLDVVPEPSGRSILDIYSIMRPIVYVIFCLAVGFCPIRGVGGLAIAAPVKTVSNLDKNEKKLVFKGHEYSDYTKRLLEMVSRVLRCIEEIKVGNEGEKQLEAAIKAVREKKEELEKEIMSGLYRDLLQWKGEKERLMQRSEEIVDEVVRLRREYENAVKEGEKERAEGVEMRLEKLEEEYGDIWEKVGEIEDRIRMRETKALSIGVREIYFIERECEQLVERFRREMQRKSMGQR